MNILKNSILPNYETYESFAKKHGVVPVIKTISGDMETPISLFTKLSEEKHCFLLESAESDGRWNRYSIIGRKSHLTMTVKDNITSITSFDKTDEYNINPLSVISNLVNEYSATKYDYIPRYFCGLTGYFGYDMIKYSEKIELSCEDDLDLPEACLMIPEEVVVYDHFKQNISLIVNCFFDNDKSDKNIKSNYDIAKQRINQLERLINLPVDRSISKKNNNNEIKITSNIDKESFMKNVEIAKDYIYNGDIFQVVLSQRLKTTLSGITDFDVYRKLRLLNPSPYMYFLKFDGYSIVGASPEMLVRLNDDKIENCPIAGTRKRGETEEEDKFLENDLLNDEKELAEHVMLVDLGRNDVGKVSEFGSVEVFDYKHIEKYSHVMHIVSNVIGKKSNDKTSIDVLKAVMPAGTVSGAPKVRAMQIIDELEATKRGIYAGAIGYIGFDGNMDTCITIRTALIKGNDVYVQAGAGIVADSVPENEYYETMNKAKALIMALG